LIEIEFTVGSVGRQLRVNFFYIYTIIYLVLDGLTLH